MSLQDAVYGSCAVGTWIVTELGHAVSHYRVSETVNSFSFACGAEVCVFICVEVCGGFGDSIACVRGDYRAFIGVWVFRWYVVGCVVNSPLWYIGL